MSKLAAAKPCAGCGHTEFTRDFSATAGDILCSGCGMVQVENPIVSEVQFGESSSGAATVQGAMVGADQARVYNMRNSLESREQTLMNARQKIKLLAAAMRIPDYIHESAHGWFKLALVQNFVQGRRSQNVIAACLYVACRHEKTPHLLIDFSSRLQISVYSLGATYLKLVRALSIQRLPLADPSLFIQHFAERLNFAEHTAKVCRDATKIAQRMSSDWIYEGRRPAGIAGACLLLAARMNNFRRSHGEIVAVARVGEETLQKRLNEFKKTSSASLSVSDFRDSAATNDSRPPSFQQNRNIEAKIEKLLKQRTHTLKKYRELAKKKKLFDHLRMDEEDDPAPVEPAPNESAPNESASLETAPNESISLESAPNESTSLESGPNESASVEPPTQTADSNTGKADTHTSNNANSKETDSASSMQENLKSSVPVSHMNQQSETNERTTAEVNSARDKADSQSQVEVQPLNERGVRASETSTLHQGVSSGDQGLQTDTNSEQLGENQEKNKTAEVEPSSGLGKGEPGVAKTLTRRPVARALRSQAKAVTKAPEEDENVNELFVPESDEDDPFGHNQLPDTSENAAATFDEHHSKIMGFRSRVLRPTTVTVRAPPPKPVKARPTKTARLGSIASTRGSRRGAPQSKQKRPAANEAAKKKKQEAELKKQKEKQKAEEREARNDELLKAVLKGGDIKEEDLEIALDRILEGQRKSLDESLYRTPAQIQNETDIMKQIDLDRPRNLVRHNPTTSEILSRVRDDEIINSDDEDEEVLSIKLDDDERQQKERIWIALNHDFLIAQEKRRLKLEADELTGNTSGQNRKRRKIKDADAVLDDAAVANAIHQIGEGGRFITPAENAKQMLQKKSFSRKINYSSIGDLFNE